MHKQATRDISDRKAKKLLHKLEIVAKAGLKKKFGQESQKNCCISRKFLHKHSSARIYDQKAKTLLNKLEFSISRTEEELLIGKLKNCCIHWKLFHKQASRKLSHMKAKKLLHNL